MRKITAIAYVSIDGIMQSPGSKSEDTSNNFKHGGWVAPFMEDLDNPLMKKLLRPSDLLLGRLTFDIWEDYWPKNANHWPGINEVSKYVLSTSKEASTWENTVFVKNKTEIIALKKSKGSDLKIWGSSKLVQLLLKHDLVDDIWLIICPVMLGRGKKLFAEGAIAATYELVESSITPKGILFVNYKRKGDLNTGTIGKST